MMSPDVYVRATGLRPMVGLRRPVARLKSSFLGLRPMVGLRRPSSHHWFSWGRS